MTWSHKFLLLLPVAPFEPVCPFFQRYFIFCGPRGTQQKNFIIWTQLNQKTCRRSFMLISVLWNDSALIIDIWLAEKFLCPSGPAKLDSCSHLVQLTKR